MAELIKVALLGREHAVVLPDYATREEILVAYGDCRKRDGVALLRVYSAALGLCTRLGRQSGVEYADCRFDVLAYGGKVYGWLREQGVTATQIADAALPCVSAAMETSFPRAVEVEAAAGKSEGDEETMTASPST